MPELMSTPDAPQVPGGTEACEILHVDMDAFFVSVEVLDAPSLAGKPVIVGGTGARGVVASCTYEARAYGIHSAMSSYEARRRCPHAVFVEGRYDRYAETSERLHCVLLRFTPLIEPVALDEAFLDVSGARRLIGSPPVIAECIRGAVLEELGLSCCVGVARTKLLAKLASRAAKPVPSPRGNRPGPGVVVVAPSDELSFLHPLPIKALWGVGPATARRLEGLGVMTVGDLAAIPDEALRMLLGSANGRRLATLANGEDDRPVEGLRETKSVGHEETFAVDLRDPESLHRHVVRMADGVASRLREADLRGRTITLKVRHPDRSTISRSQTLQSATDSARAIAAVAGALLCSVEVSRGVRLLGVSLSALARGSAMSRQLSFETSFETVSGTGLRHWFVPGELSGADPGGDRDALVEREAAWEEVEAAVTQIRVRYGRSAVSSAALVGPDGISVKRWGDARWGPSGSAR
ncbi:MAG: DNA polymerase IV [Acidimicrobiales bacterium]